MLTKDKEAIAHTKKDQKRKTLTAKTEATPVKTKEGEESVR